MKDWARFELIGDDLVGRGGRRRKSGKLITARCPKQVREIAAIGMAGGVNAFVVHSIVVSERSEDGIKKFQVAAVKLAGLVLPTGGLALMIDKAVPAC